MRTKQEKKALANLTFPPHIKVLAGMKAAAQGKTMSQYIADLIAADNEEAVSEYIAERMAAPTPTPTPPPTPTPMSVAEAAAATGYSERSIQGKLADGTVQGYKVRGTWRIDVSEIEKLKGGKP